MKSLVFSTHAVSKALHAYSAADNKTTDEPFCAQYTIPLFHISNMILTSQYNERQLWRISTLVYLQRHNQFTSQRKELMYYFSPNLSFSLSLSLSLNFI